MSVYAAGRTTGLVADAGDGLFQTIPVVEGLLISYAVEMINISGRYLTDWMRKLLQRNG
jgi:actin-related protein